MKLMLELVAPPTRFDLIMSMVLILGVLISVGTIPIIQQPAGPTIGTIATLLVAFLVNRFVKH